MNDTDAELVQRYKKGDRQAFAELARRHQDGLYRLALVWLQDQQFAGDAVQEVFVRAHKGLRGFRFKAAPFTWLYRTTYNICREFNRRQPAVEFQDRVAEDSIPIEEQQIAEHCARQIRQLVMDLPERQRQVVLLRIFEEYSVRETARLMGCREGTVKALLFKAMAQLKLKSSWIEEQI